MVEIPGGTFMMGSPEDELERNEDESPKHQVTVSSFHMAKFLVTQAQWKQIAALPKIERGLKLYPSDFRGDNLPVESVSWNDAVEFCKRLSQYTDKLYRLPSEAEWEYACRAGTTTPFYFGETITDDLANYDDELERNKIYRKQTQTTLVGSYFHNAFGLYDMKGKIYQFCEDDWHDSYHDAPSDGTAWIDKHSCSKVMRGSYFRVFPSQWRSAFRRPIKSNILCGDYGFRVALVSFKTT